ncbi:hypothetical protein [Sphingomonas sp.]|uniref:hypothetical protein n=1 Tax=Sphingomonas sp. TaxID=28214 RepID=UPI002DD6A553|nr:hypothetical protein [Sphingomonas sp.]
MPITVGFLLNHDALHQIGHVASAIRALAEDARASVCVLTSTDAQQARVCELIGAEAAARVRFVALDLSTVARLLDKGLRRVLPFRRVAVLWENRAEFARLDVLVVPESTSLILRDTFGLKRLCFVRIPHGSGDRSISYRKVGKGFDLTLVSGEKVRRGMIDNGVVTPDAIEVVGYPKFDTVDIRGPRPPLFDNGRPTALYNPHFDPRLSSWYPMGEAVVDWFATQAHRINLTVAPHVMLFKRRLHSSVEHRRIARRRDLPARWRGLHNVAVDTGSVRSTDMSYTLGADLYIGDASSQIYEFIARPRPAIFLNPNRLDWRDRPEFEHWRLGEVVETIEELDGAVTRALADPHRFDDLQRAAFDWTFDRADLNAGARAAEAILTHFAGFRPRA